MQPETSTRKLNPTIISSIVVALIAIAAGTAYAVSSNDSPVENTSANVSSDSATDDATAANTNPADYADGSYTATGSYSTPGGMESVTVTATLSNGTITAIDTTGSATGGNSTQYQSAFLSNYESLVKGKPITSVTLSRVAGSSLTSNGFNAAIAEIRADALS